MWSPLEAQLFTSLDVSTGEIEGFDRNVLADLIKLYLLKPTVSQEVSFRVSNFPGPIRTGNVIESRTHGSLHSTLVQIGIKLFKY